MNKDKHGHYIVLDGMRGIAAIAVMIFHFTSHFSYQTFSNAPVAVDLFFILSGFVLSFSYGEKVLNGEVGFADFLCRRVIRLYPMFIIGLLWGSVDLYFYRKFDQTTYSLHEIAAALVYNSFFLPFANAGSIHMFERSYSTVGTLFPANGAAWSLFCEMLANLFFFRLIFMTRKFLVTTILISFGLLVGLSIATNFSQYAYTLSVDAGWGTVNMLPGIARVFFGFTLGILIQKSMPSAAVKDAFRPLLKNKIFSSFSKYPLILYALLIALFLIPYQFYGLTSLLSVGLLCPAFVIVGAFARTNNKLILASSKFLGWISYPVYCLHTPVGNLIALANNEFGLYKSFSFPFAISSSLATIVICIVLTIIYENPSRAHLMAITKNWRQNQKAS